MWSNLYCLWFTAIRTTIVVCFLVSIWLNCIWKVYYNVMHCTSLARNVAEILCQWNLFSAWCSRSSFGEFVLFDELVCILILLDLLHRFWLVVYLMWFGMDPWLSQMMISTSDCGGDSLWSSLPLQSLDVSSLTRHRSESQCKHHMCNFGSLLSYS